MKVKEIGSDILICHLCGGRAEIKGRCATARVVCKDCGQEQPIKEYRDDIEYMKETWICALNPLKKTKE